MKPAARLPAPVSFERLPGLLQIRWDDLVHTEITSRELRLGCPCAACVEEWSGRRMVDASQIADDIGVVAIEPVGNYAVTVTFTDGHSTGIYSWKTLRSLGKVL
jgi:DUF971 family protein